MELDNLQIKISADAQSAIKSLNLLKNALTGIDAEAKKNSFEILADKVNAFARAVHKSVRDVERLGNAVQNLNSLKWRLPSDTTKNINSVKSALPPVMASAGEIEPEKEAVKQLVRAQETAKETTHSLTQAYKAKNKALDKQTAKTKQDSKAVKQYGKSTQNATKHTNKFGSSILRILKYRIIRSVLKTITEAFREGLQNLYQFSKGLDALGKQDTSGGISNTLDQLTSTLLQLKNTLGVTFGYLVIAFQPIITAMSDGLMKLAESINILMSDALGNKTFYRAKYTLKEYMETAKETTKANKGMLQSFDEINNITTGNDNGVDYNDMFEQVEITNQLRREASETLLTDAAAVVAAVGAYEGLKAIVKLVTGLFNKKNDSLDKQSQKTATETGLVTALAGAFVLVASGVTVVDDALDWLKEKLGGNWQPIPDLVPEPVRTAIEEAGEALGLINEKNEELQTEWTPVKDLVPQPVRVAIDEASDIVEEATGKTKELRTEFEKPLPKVVPQATMVNLTDTTEDTNDLTQAKIDLEKKWNPLSKIIPNPVLDNLLNATGDTNSLKQSKEKLTSQWRPLAKIVPQTVTDNLTDTTTKVNELRTALEKLQKASPFSNSVEQKSTLTSTTEQTFLKGYEVRELQNQEGAKLYKEIENAFPEALKGALEKLMTIFRFVPGLSGIPAFASGGFPSAGSVFIAGEAQPELVGTINGRTAVANTDQITEAIASAVYNAIVSANSGSETKVVIEGDMGKFMRAVKQNSYNNGLRLGTV